MTRRSAVDIAEAVQRDRPRSEWIIPTAEQVAAIEAPLTPTLVVAGAGSGKTATMADRVVWLVVNELAAPEEILGLTFTRKAAGELAERVRRNLRRAREAGLISGELGDVATPTYNSFAASVVRDHALRIGRDPDAALVTRAGEWQLISEVVEGWQGPLELGGALSTIKSNALTLAEELRSHLVGVDEVREFTNRILPEVELISQAGTTKKSREAAIRAAESLRNRLELLRIVEVFYALMRERGLVTFSDQVGMACEIAATVPAVGALFRSQYRSVLLDEFQDTSVAQLTFLHDLFGSGFPAMAVGDPNQAIYGWRGASASSLVSFAEMFAAEDQPTVVLPLSVSWRNDSAILRAANITAAPLADEEGAGRLLTELRERPGVSEGEVHRSVALTEPEEASEIARWVAERWTPGVVSAAVLCRGGNQFPSLIRAFRELGIEPEVVGLKGLLNTPEMADIRAALEVVADSSRGDAMMRLLTNERLGLADLHVLGEWAVSLAGGAARGDADVSAAVVEAVDSLPPTDFVTKGGNRLSPEGRRRVERLREQIREIRRSLAYPLPDLVSAAERALLLDIEVAARPGISPAAARRNLDHFAAHVSSYAAGSAAPTLGGLLEWLTSADEAEAGLDAAPDAAHSEAVQILTMHGAKGLEWDVVAVAGMTEGTFPHRRNNAGRLAERETGWIRSAAMIPGPLRGDARHLPTLEEGATTPAEFTEGVERFEGELFEHSILEERRLAYVAITRARHQVLLSGSHFRSGKKPLPLSRFLTELEGASVVPSGFSVVAPPDPDSEPAEEVAGEPVTYPAADPLAADLLAADPLASEGPAPSRRTRLERAAAGVAAATHGGDQEAAERQVAALAERASTPSEAALVEDARVLIREANARSGPDLVELPQHLSASATLALTRSPGEFALNLRRPIPHRPSPEARVGTEFHGWVEHHFNMPTLMGSPEWDEDEDAAGAPQRFAELRARFLESEWALRAPLSVEENLETMIGGQLIRCRIDAVFRRDGEIWVVDWKTGREPRDRAEIEIRQLQLEIYRLAYARANGIPIAEVKAAFHYVATGVTQASGLWQESEIERRILDALESQGALESLSG